MKRCKNHHAALVLILLFGFLFALSGCGGGGGTSAVAPVSPGTATAATMNGTAVKGPVNRGTIRAYAVDSGVKGSMLASALTDSTGNFSMTIHNYSGPVMLVMSGGTYTDEATGSMMTMGTTDVMTAMVPTISSGATVTGIMITPLTSMAQTMAAHLASGMTTTNMDAANTAVGNYFMVNDILHTMPVNPLVTGSATGASQDSINYGISLAAMTQYAQSIGMPDSSGIVTAMMDDASDGVMNGMTGSTQISMSGMGGMGSGMMGGGGGPMMQSNAGTTGLATAMTDFMNSSMNKSGLTAADMNALISHLSTTNGTL